MNTNIDSLYPSGWLPLASPTGGETLLMLAITEVIIHILHICCMSTLKAEDISPVLISFQSILCACHHPYLFPGALFGNTVTHSFISSYCSKKGILFPQFPAGITKLDWVRNEQVPFTKERGEIARKGLFIMKCSFLFYITYIGR